MQRLQFILMGDVRRSSELSPLPLLRAFRKLVGEANRRFAPAILSPLTITLGDEFQGIVRSLRGGLDLIFFLEERGLTLEPEFRLRLVLHRGAVATPINRARAHGMMGAGLAHARARLEELKSQPRRIAVETGLAVDAPIGDALFLHEEILGAWRTPLARRIAARFLAGDDYRKAAARVGLHPTSVLRRRRTLRLDSYWKTKALLEWLADSSTGATSPRSL
jgi:hypothetical protein